MMKNTFVFILLLALTLLSGSASAAAGEFLSDDPLNRLSTIPHDPEFAAQIKDSGIESIAVRHEGWNETLHSWSRLKIYELTGRTQIHGQDPAYTALSIMYEPQRWYDAKFIPIEHPRIGEVLHLSGHWASPRSIMENPNLKTLETALQDMQARKEEYDALVKQLNAAHQVIAIDPNRPGIFETIVPPDVDANAVTTLVRDEAARNAAHQRRIELRKLVKADEPFLKAGTMLVNRVVLAFELPSQFLIVPDSESINGQWVTAPHSGHHHEEGESHVHPVAFRSGASKLMESADNLNAALATAFASHDGSNLRHAVMDFLRVVDTSRYYPAFDYLARKNLYVRTNPARLASYVYGLSIALFGLFVFFRARAWRIAGTVALLGGFVLHTLDLALRISLTGHMPVSNMYESIVFVAWSAMLIGAAGEIWKRKGYAGLAAAVVGTLALLGVSLMPLHETRIHPLRAVLNSYWLNIHVTMMLLSYGAFAVSSLFALGYLVKSFSKRTALFGRTELMPLDQMEEFAYRLVQVGWPILTVGVCLGAVWADTAWGRFWGWDPKETWAFITWIVYTIYLHTRMVVGWKGRVSAVACLIGFLMVMVTWIGVSYIPWFAGGLHTYASPT